ncbi:FecCD family ABC transporter permease [Paenibacillus sabinae]|uniref:Iron(III) ABC transporter n=1 Tax=Paenibacillus sabinae T27 TaxID=1268072 RepID=X5A4X8_9BACL|nr:iron ABC transporter permease [Paenibacillus sabinae]AHV98824.1 iron(III) ABC transporter [Paenibacillus sabinae T27]
MKTRHLILIGIIPFLLSVVSLFLGRYHAHPKEVLLTFTQLFTQGGTNVGIQSATVVLQLRLPRIIAAAFVGAGLAVSGAAFQGVFHNPLVNSGLLGVSSGAGFGAALAIILFQASWATYPFAFVFGLIAVAASYWVARIYKTVPTIMLVLGGTIISSIFNALVSLLKFVADTDRQLPAIVYWLMGSLSSVAYKDFWALIPIGMGILILIGFSWKVNVLSMGDKEAQTMGVDVIQTKAIIIVGATLATAGAVCMAGVVGWVGLVIPHIGRMVAGNDNRKLIPLSISLGAAFMILIDTLSRTIIESEIPLGILTSLVGAPFFIYLIKKTKGGGWR